MDDLISRTWLLAEYDKRHKGPPGGARKLIEEASLAEPHWIPCSERLPEKEGYFLVTVSCMGVIYVDARFYYVERDSRHWGNYESGSVIAWMTLPAPYQSQKEVTE